MFHAPSFCHINHALLACRLQLVAHIYVDTICTKKCKQNLDQKQIENSKEKYTIKFVQ